MKITNDLALDLMPKAYFVIGRRELPASPTHLDLRLEDQRGRVEVRDSRQIYHAGESWRLWESYCEMVVGWPPVSSVHVVGVVPPTIDWEADEVADETVAITRLEISVADEIARVVSVELAASIEGAVFTHDNTRIFEDAQGHARPLASMIELEGRLTQAFESAVIRGHART